MTREWISVTAERTAFARAVETDRPPGRRLLSDPLAKYFLGQELAEIYESRELTAGLLKLWEEAAPGVMGSVLVRSRFIDDYLHSCLDAGVRQIVILGAGYDSRAYRLPGLREGVSVFEIDRPGVLTRKKTVLKKVLTELPGHVAFIELDFLSEDPIPAMMHDGYDPTLKSLFIMEGLTYYLTGEAVDLMLDFITDFSVNGSPVVFDFFPRSVADGTSDLPEARVMQARMTALGEALTFGLKPDLIESFLHGKGFEKVVVMDHNALRLLYSEELKSGPDLSTMFYLALAETKARI